MNASATLAHGTAAGPRRRGGGAERRARRVGQAADSPIEGARPRTSRTPTSVDALGGRRHASIGLLIGIGAFAAALSVNSSLLVRAVAATLAGQLDRAPLLRAAATATDAALAAVVSVAVFALVRRLCRGRAPVFWITAGASLAIALVGPVAWRALVLEQPLALDPAAGAALVATRALAAGITAAMLLTLAYPEGSRPGGGPDRAPEAAPAARKATP